MLYLVDLGFTDIYRYNISVGYIYSYLLWKVKLMNINQLKLGGGNEKIVVSPTVGQIPTDSNDAR